MRRQSIVDSPDIGDKMRELQRREGRLPPQKPTHPKGLHPFIDHPKHFPTFIPLQDAPPDVDGILIYLHASGVWGCRNGFRHCRSCHFPNDVNCCISGRGITVAYWAPPRG